MTVGVTMLRASAAAAAASTEPSAAVPCFSAIDLAWAGSVSVGWTMLETWWQAQDGSLIFETRRRDMSYGTSWSDNFCFFFFFFKQKTAYGILSGLVGSEMCIRDRIKAFLGLVVSHVQEQ